MNRDYFDRGGISLPNISVVFVCEVLVAVCRRLWPMELCILSGGFRVVVRSLIPPVGGDHASVLPFPYIYVSMTRSLSPNLM